MASRATRSARHGDEEEPGTPSAPASEVGATLAPTVEAKLAAILQAQVETQAAIARALEAQAKQQAEAHQYQRASKEAERRVLASVVKLGDKVCNVKRDRPLELVTLLGDLELIMRAHQEPERRVALAAQFETRSSTMASTIRERKDPLTDAALDDKGAEWRLAVLAVLEADKPSITWLVMPRQHETASAYIQRSQIEAILPLIVSSAIKSDAIMIRTAQELKADMPMLEKALRAVVESIVRDMLLAAIPRDHTANDIRKHLELAEADTSLLRALYAIAAQNAKFDDPRGAEASKSSTTTTKKYATASIAFAPREADVVRGAMRVGHMRAPAVDIEVIVDTGGSHVLVSDELLATLPGRPVELPNVPAITSLQFADGSIRDAEARAVALEVHLDDGVHAVIAHVVPEAAAGMVFGVAGMRDVGGVEVVVPAKGDPVVKLNKQARVPTIATTSAATAEQAVVADSAVVLFFDGVAVECFGRGLADDRGFYVSEAQIGCARQLAEAVQGAASDEELAARATAWAHSKAGGTAATACLFTPQLDKPAFEPAVERVPVPDAATRTTYRFASGKQKLYQMIDSVGGMPRDERRRLKQEIEKSEATFLSEEAPPAPYGPVRGPGSVYEIRLRADADLSQVYQPWRPVAIDKAEALKKTKEAWLRFGIIEPVQPGETQCLSQPVVVPKRDSDGRVIGHRVAIDFRQLNKQVEPDRYSPPPINELLTWVAGTAWRATVLDMRALFNQFSIRPDMRYLTTVMLAPGEYYRFVGSPFGLATILAWAQRFMDKTFGNDYTRVYVDDCVMRHVERDNWRRAVDELLTFVRRAASVNMAINVDKAQLFKEKVGLLGHVVDCNTHSFAPRQSKIELLRDWPLPNNNKKLLGFLQHAAFWASFLPGWAMVAPRLRKLVSKGSVLEWTADGRRAFEEAKKLLANACSKVPLNGHDQVYLYTDGCRDGLGWAVAQEVDGHMKLIDAGGRRTHAFERRLSVPELEFLAGREAMQRAAHLLLGLSKPPIWRVDSQAVVGIRHQKKPVQSDAVRRWQLEMQYGDFAVMRCEHVPGAENPADALSRAVAAAGDGGIQLPLMPLRAALAATFSVSTPVSDAAQTPTLVSPTLSDDGVTNEDALEKRAVATATSMDDDQVQDEPAAATGSEAEDDDVEEEPEPSPAALRAVLDALSEDESTAGALDDRQMQWGLASIADDSREAVELRKAAQGKWVNSKRVRRLQAVRDEHGRLFVWESGVRKLYAPTLMLRPLALAAHASAANGGAHRAASTVCAVLRKRFYSPQLESVVKNVVDECAVCQKLKRRPHDGLLGSDERVQGRFRAVSIDVAQLDGEQPYCLVMIDKVTGIVEAAPLTRRDADHVAEAFEQHWLLRYGAPEIVTLDNAKELIGKKMQQLEEDWHFKLDPVAPRNPQGNGLAERAVGMLKTAIRALTPLGGDWRQALAAARWSIVCAVSSSRRFSPFRLAHGTEPRLAIDEQHDNNDKMPRDVAERGKQAREEWHAQQAARADTDARRANENRERRHAQAARYVLRQAGGQQATFNVDDVVWVENSGNTLKTKFDNLWRRDGPFSVVRTDVQRQRAKLVRWESRAPMRGWVSFRRLTKVQGWEKKTTSKEESATGEHKLPIDIKAGGHRVRDIVHTVNGPRVLLQVPLPSGEHVLRNANVDGLPHELVQAAWRAKRVATAPRQVRRGIATTDGGIVVD